MSEDCHGPEYEKAMRDLYPPKTVAEVTEDLMVTQYGYKFEHEQATATPEYDQLITVSDRYFLMELNIEID